MIIENNMVVTLHYRLQEGDAQGALVEETFGSEPLVFLYGAGSMIPEFERNLAGKKIGDEFAFGIIASEAYGEVDPDALVELPSSTFVVDGRLATELLQVGRTIPMADQYGNRLMGTVKAVNADTVLIDFNHPMAGQDLYFTGVIDSIRLATPSEIEHGHVHGPGDHHDH